MLYQKTANYHMKMYIEYCKAISSVVGTSCVRVDIRTLNLCRLPLKMLCCSNTVMNIKSKKKDSPGFHKDGFLHSMNTEKAEI
jgi:hypothetical protein